MRQKLSPFLADTLWFGMTSRLSFSKFQEYAHLRAEQGFNAVQVVVGVPPEVGPYNINARGKKGPAWNLEGSFNEKFLQNCEKKIQVLNKEGLKVIIYGAWGHQINWLRGNRMKDWWDEIINRFEKYDVIFCVCGESNLWIGSSDMLLPNKSTDELITQNFLKRWIYNTHFPYKSKLIKVWNNSIEKLTFKSQNKETISRRIEAWSEVLEHIQQKTNKPIIIHTIPQEQSTDAVNNAHHLSAVTVQTGHDIESRTRIWKEPLSVLKKDPQQKFINLEPWYEGILNNFYTEDQIFAYWASMLAGASAYCYGAHGIWNIGDGNFLSHWGKQTFEEALHLSTPALLGKSHKMFIDSGAIEFPLLEIEAPNDHLKFILRKNLKGKYIYFYPDIKQVDKIQPAQFYYNPLTGKFLTDLPESGPLVGIGKEDY